MCVEFFAAESKEKLAACYFARICAVGKETCFGGGAEKLTAAESRRFTERKTAFCKTKIHF
jgi:hypothetical protein